MGHLLKPLLNRRPVCALCHLSPAAKAKQLCVGCWQNLPWITANARTANDINVHAACCYAWPVDRLIHLYKYQGRLDLLPVLTELLLKLPKPDAQAIVAVPLSNNRLKQRGFNQSLLLARQLSKHWRIPVWQPLHRHHTIAQQHLSRSERISNLAQAFYINPAQCRVIVRKVVVIDDVFTTGSTLLALEEQLKNIGVKHIQHYVIATADH